MKAFNRVFIAGTMQGANKGSAIWDQGYREEIPAIVRKHLPDAECFDPGSPVQRYLQQVPPDPLSAAIPGSQVDRFQTGSIKGSAQAIRTLFRDMTRKASESDLCIAYLPDHIPSMGTAMEMYSAHLGGATVVSITEMRHNLSILSISDWILRDFKALDSWLSETTYARKK